jgi:hypothetical protein
VRYGFQRADAESAFGVGAFVFREEPEADGNLRAVEELAGEGEHAVHEVGPDSPAWMNPLTNMPGGHRHRMRELPAVFTAMVIRAIHCPYFSRIHGSPI